MKGLFCKLKKNQFGRTMTEMLGVLAVIGVLSIGAISGYRLSMNKLRANELINEMNTRRVALYQQFLKDPENVDMEMGEQTKQGYKISAETDKSEENVFYMKVETIPLGVCKELLSRNWKAPLSIYVDDVLAKNGETSGCGENDTVKMTFKFDKYGNPWEDGDASGDETTTVEETTSMEETTTVEETNTGRCPENHMKDDVGNCHSCDEEEGIFITSFSEKCNACPNRIVNGGYCILPCPSDKPLIGYDGNCHSCNEVDRVYVSGVEKNCNVCPNRILVNSWYCALKE